MEKYDVVQFNENHKWIGSFGVITEVKEITEDIRYQVAVPIPNEGPAYIYVLESESAIEKIGVAKLILKEE